LGVRAGPDRQGLAPQGQPEAGGRDARRRRRVRRPATGQGGRARRGERKRALRSAGPRGDRARHVTGPRVRPEAVLVGVTVLWGSTFVVTKDVVRGAPPLTWLALRV